MLIRPILLLLALAAPAVAGAAPAIVAAENFYGDVAAQVANTPVSSVLERPDQDPHAFEAKPSVVRGVAGADVVVMNGLGYDPWMTRLLGRPRPGRVVVVAAEAMGRTSGNPHLWYDPATLPTVALAIQQALTRADPAGAPGYAARRAAFDASFAPVAARVAALRGRYAGQAVAATEPVFGLMAAALGLVMRHERFQKAVMNGTEPRASDIAALEADLRARRVRALIYNSQATGPAAARLVAIARQAGVPELGVTETMPAGTHVQDWMMATLDALDAALSQPAP